ncbi:glycosyl hydrolase family 115 (putative glucuronidase) [Acidipila rosea]|uniref:Glycosyl hydrolase family 115 (Putative glucuronidase) n=2 Tax=Acidipila rosea TaxID=768535 RepID=A0A4R1L702_9BACT|nr:glycosyl hydrolase family 115 (putative glucuronidase) [Acidipila rosea]
MCFSSLSLWNSRSRIAQPARFKRVCTVLGVLILASLAPRCFALGQPRYVETASSPGSFTLVQAGAAAKLYVDSSDYAGVTRAAHDLQQDINRVSGVTPDFLQARKSLSGNVILIGTIGRSEVIDRLIREHKIDVSQIRGKWESTLIQVVSHPLPGVARALVIAGSDKRGAIYGIYDLSEQIGVSPWYWWADVPVRRQSALFVKDGRYIQGEPAVKYRGIFLNDEAPSLTGWVYEKFGGYNHLFYEKVFELLLRLKANYLWPAMWNNAFNEDDPLNPRLADEYGIVMGTSHHEPMLRAQQEWKRHGTGPWDYSTNAAVLDSFWEKGIERNANYESTITLGMRGDGDMPMSETDNVALLEKIVAKQRQIISQHLTPTLAADPQVWALYKEVQGYYEKGMRVPDDVTLLWCDDNWGNIRRLPTPAERKRSGGAGIYYHFDYVGDPRSYKWLNTNPIPKVWEQMHLAHEYGANRIWIVNVGDLKPMEFPIEFFLDYARDPSRWNQDNFSEFTQLWAAREFGPQHAAEIAEIVAKYTKYNGRRKPELLEPDTFSLVHYQEADRVYAGWEQLTRQAEAIYKELPVESRDAYFELVLYPVKASAIVNELYITAGRNHLHAAQGRVSTNDLAAQARVLFKEDADLTYAYNHTLAHGKWDKMMSQTHIGYTFWNEPPLNAMPAVSEVQPDADAKMAVAVDGSAIAATDNSASLRLPPFDSFNRQTRFIDVFNRGIKPFEYSVKADQPWIMLSSTHGAVDKEQRLTAAIDWSSAPAGTASGIITIEQRNGAAVKIAVVERNPSALTRASLQGFVENENYVSINAEHFTARTSARPIHWQRIPDFGETLSGMTVMPVTAQSVLPPQPSASLEYRMYLFDSGKFNIEAILAPTLRFVPGRGLRYMLSIDDQPPLLVDALAHDSEKNWATDVKDGVRKVTSTLSVNTPGYHTLKFWMVDPGVVLEKLVVSHGSVAPSYLGPPESYHNLQASNN